MSLDAVDLAKGLISYRSDSSQSNRPVTEYVRSLVADLGFEIELVSYEGEDDDGAGGAVPKDSLVARLGPSPTEGAAAGAPTGGMAYFAHTDTVPGTPWLDPDHDAFDPVLRDGKLFGRGACDMKGSLASMLAAASRVDAASLTQPLYIVCTADEEVGYGGARAVSDRSRLYADLVAAADMHAIIGEPTLLEVVYAHKGGVAFTAVARGQSAHTSTAEGSNAMWKLVPFLTAIDEVRRETETEAWWDDEFTPPTINLTISVTDDQPALNVKAAYAECRGSFRPSPRTATDTLVEKIAQAAAATGVEYVETGRSEPIYTPPDSDVVRTMIELTGVQRAMTAPYGTDASALDGLRNVVVCGPGSVDQAHKHDESIAVDQLRAGADLYERCAARWCTG